MLDLFTVALVLFVGVIFVLAVKSAWESRKLRQFRYVRVDVKGQQFTFTPDEYAAYERAEDFESGDTEEIQVTNDT